MKKMNEFLSERGQKLEHVKRTWSIHVMKTTLYTVRIYVSLYGHEISAISSLKNNNRTHGTASHTHPIYSGKNQQEAIEAIEKSIKQTITNFSQ